MAAVAKLKTPAPELFGKPLPEPTEAMVAAKQALKKAREDMATVTRGLEASEAKVGELEDKLESSETERAQIARLLVMLDDDSTKAKTLRGTLWTRSGLFTP